MPSNENVVTLPPAGGCVGEWSGWWLRVTCSCRTVDHPVDWMLQHLPAWLPMSAAAARFRCTSCGESVRRATLQDDQRTGAKGMPHHKTGIFVPVLDDLLGQVRPALTARL